MPDRSSKTSCLLILATLLCAASPPVLAQETSASTGTLAPVEIRSKKNPGDLPYKAMFRQQSDLLSYLPAEPRMIDMRLRVSFTAIDVAKREAYLPDTWAVAIVGDTIDEPVAVTRGGYFLRPDIKQAAAERATIMFNTQTRKNWLDVAWMVRTREDNTIAYSDLSKAFDEVRSTQHNIPWYRIAFRFEKTARFDALKACFSSTGDILLDGQPAETISRGPCKLLKFEPARAAGAASVITLVGAVAHVTLDSIGDATPRADNRR